ncbi:MAG: Ig-like domain-containing protein, partial [Gammaproteobacteria bacterium]|nr:Ig-like domain-containing protein [Gammaproteobacteria bacterium]
MRTLVPLIVSFFLLSACGFGNNDSLYTGLLLNSGTDTIFIGDTIRIDATLTDEFEFDRSGNTRVVWTSSNESVATIDQGILTAQWEGTVTIYATFESFQESLTFTIIPKLTHLEITPDKTDQIKTGDRIKLFAKAFYNNDTSIDITKTAKWVVNNSDIFSFIDTHEVIALASGTAIIQAEYLDIYKNKELSNNNAIKKAMVKGINEPLELGKELNPTLEITYDDDTIEEVIQDIDWTFPSNAFKQNEQSYTPIATGKTIVSASYLNASTEIEVTIIDPLQLYVKSDTNKIELQWHERGNTNYRLYWNTMGDVDTNSDYFEITQKNTFTHQNVERGKKYYYRLAFTDTDGMNIGSQIQVTPRRNTWHKTSSFQTAKSAQTVLQINDSLFVMGGHDFNPETGYSIYNGMITYDLKTGNSIPGSTESGRTNTAACTDGNFIYSLGGLAADQNNNIATDVNHRYDIVKDEWIILEPMHQPLHGHSCEYNNGFLYIIGGLTTSNMYNDKLYIYNISDDLWEEKPSAKISRAFFTSNIKDEKIVIIGGITQNGYTNSVEIYDIQNNEWSSGTDLPINLAYHASSLSNNTLYVTGGETFLNGIYSSTRKTFKYSIDQDFWEAKDNFLISRAEHKSFIYADRLFLFGGTTLVYDLPILTTESMDLTLEKWLLKAPLHFEAKRYASAAVGSSIFIFGGDRESVSTQVDRLDLDSNTWTNTVSQMKQAQQGLTALAYKENIYTIGGLNAKGEAEASLSRYSPSTDNWTDLTPAPTINTYASYTINHNTIYRIGGKETPAQVTTYNIETDEWQTASDLLTARHSATSVALNDYIYVMGGVSNLRDTRVVERYNTKLGY